MSPDRPTLAQAILQEGPDVLLALRVQPRAARNELRLTHDPPQITVRLTAPPVEGAANDACRAFLAERLDLASARVTLVRGERSRHKLFRLRGVNADHVRRRLLETL
jgi:uncharacterized protein (TIGR00251 family)